MEIVYSLSLSPSQRNAKIMWARQKANDERGRVGEVYQKKPGRSRRLKFPISISFDRHAKCEQVARNILHLKLQWDV